MAKKKPKTTYVYEAVIRFTGFQDKLFINLNNKEWSRLATVLESDPFEGRFYGFDVFDIPNGYYVFINPRHVFKINLLENLPGIEFIEKEPQSQEKWEEIEEERASSYEEMTLRVWAANGEIEDYAITYEEYEGFQGLEDSTSLFIGFIDEDGERVMLNLDQISAIEIFDPYFLSEDEISALMRLPKEGVGNLEESVESVSDIKQS